MNYLPNDTSEILGSQPVDNFALKLNKIHKHYSRKDGFSLFKKDNKQNTTPYEVPNSFDDETFKVINKRQLNNAKLLFGDTGLCTIELAPDYRLIVGLGEESVYETSMTLHHIYGVPFIPGQSIKGSVRSYVINNYFKNEDDALDDHNFRSIFGGPKNDKFDKDQQGKIIFLDAFPIKTPTITTDIMNPHYSDYYKDGSVPPGDYMNPVPIPFLTIGKNKSGESVFFNFIIGIKEDNPELLEKAAEYLEKTLKSSGVGAKTAIGYGYFDEVTKILSEEEIAKQEEIEAKRQKALKIQEEKRRIKNLPAFDKIKEKVSGLSVEKKNWGIISQLVNNELKKVTPENKVKAAKVLKEYIIKADRWNGDNKKDTKIVNKIKNIMGEK